MGPRAGYAVVVPRVVSAFACEREVSYQELGNAIANVLSSIKPSQADNELRRDIVRRFTTMIQSIKGSADAKVEPYGSFAYNIYTKDADLDMSVDIPNLLSSDAAVLEKIWRFLQERNQPGVQIVLRSRIPHLTFDTTRGNFSCDITINNHLGKIRSKFLLWISKIDKRFCNLVLLVKAWARAHNINNPKDGTFNSYALCLLVIFHLQTCVPAILPPLKDICCINDHFILKRSDETHIQQVCAANINKFISTRTVNRSTLAQLMASFFKKFSKLEIMLLRNVISTHSGKLEDRNSPRMMAQTTHNTVHIEDPIELSDNAARSVQKQHLNRISEEFKNTYDSLLVPSFWDAATTPINGRNIVVQNEKREVITHIEKRQTNSVIQGRYFQRRRSSSEVYKIIIDEIHGDQTSVDNIRASSSLCNEIIYQRKQGEEIPIGKPIKLHGPSRPPCCDDPVSIRIGPKDWYWGLSYGPHRSYPNDPNPSCEEVTAENGSKARFFYQRIERSVEADIEIIFCFEDLLGFQIQGEIFATAEGNPDTKRLLLCLDDKDEDESTSVTPDTPLMLDRSVVALSLKSVLHVSFDLMLRKYDQEFELKLDDLKFQVPEGPKEDSLELLVKVSDLLQKKLGREYDLGDDNTIASGIPDDFKIKIKVIWSNDMTYYFDEQEMDEFDISSSSEDEDSD